MNTPEIPAVLLALSFCFLMMIGDCIGCDCSQGIRSCTTNHQQINEKEKKIERRGKVIKALKKKFDRWIEKDLDEQK